MIELSAVICTRDGADRIGPALESLLAQTDPPDEVLVVDNAPSSPRTQELLRARFPTVRYLVEAVPGLDFARNSALAHAGGRLVAFLDDDAVAAPDWTRTMQAAFASNPSLVACTSRVTALRLDTPARRLFEANGGLDRGEEPIVLPRDATKALNGFRGSLIAWATRIGIGCGLCVRRHLALDMGGFDPALDLGPALPGGGDSDFVWRAVAAGHEVAYLPEARIHHDHREGLEEAHRIILGHSRALIALLTKVAYDSGGSTRRSALAFLGWRLAKPALRLTKRLAGRDVLPAGLLLKMWWACWSGLVAYPLARREARRRVTQHQAEHPTG